MNPRLDWMTAMQHPEYDQCRTVVCHEDGSPVFPNEYRAPKPVVQDEQEINEGNDD